MCILIAKPAGIEKPSKELMKTCWDNNPDGAGIAWSDGRKLYLRKGMMKWQDFETVYDELELKNAPAIIHFRIATHGTVKPENTHPFNVNERIIAAHNGVLTVKNEGDRTDSETFFKRICAPILKSYPIESKEFDLCVQALIGSSKLAFITDRGKIITYGAFNEHEKVLYSNLSFEKKTSYCEYGGYSSGYSGAKVDSYVSKRVGLVSYKADAEYIKIYIDRLLDTHTILSDMPIRIKNDSTEVTVHGNWAVVRAIQATFPTDEDQVAAYAYAAGWFNTESIMCMYEDEDVYDECVKLLKGHMWSSALRKDLPTKAIFELLDSWIDEAAEQLDMTITEDKPSDDAPSDYLCESISNLSAEAYSILKDHVAQEYTLWYYEKICIDAATDAIEELRSVMADQLEDEPDSNVIELTRELMTLKYNLTTKSSNL